MKLAHDTAASEDEGWPKKMGFTRDGRAHALIEINKGLCSQLSEATESSDWERKQLLLSWICTLDNNPVWAAVVRALKNYADTGQYLHVDQVSSNQVSSRSSRAMWDEAEGSTINSRPPLSAHYEHTIEGADFAPFEEELGAAVTDSIRRWVSIACSFGSHAMLGEHWRVTDVSALRWRVTDSGAAEL
ncbi:hypothetical protein [Nocardia seriolae]|uniref:hypothetical protein n=1 Tax=Nocardia seriolae TaxID=37332 RepID=UPI0012BB800E|nr:hypothetical protein [Nocardia seriolae]